MDMKKLIDRINVLYKKSKEEGLTPEETTEQQELRKQYIEVVKGNFRNQISGYKYEPKKKN